MRPTVFPLLKRSLVFTTHLLLCLALFGCDPLPFHWLNVAIHVLTAGALYLFAREVGMPRAFAYFGALWFTVQSGPVEAVAWIGAITDPERAGVRQLSPIGGKYDTAVNRESAHELLQRRAQAAASSSFSAAVAALAAVALVARMARV